jgi:hypothetical protein
VSKARPGPEEACSGKKEAIETTRQALAMASSSGETDLAADRQAGTGAGASR